MGRCWRCSEPKRSESLCCSVAHTADPTLHSHGDKPRRYCPRPHLRIRHFGLRGRAMRPAVDYHRYFPGCVGTGPRSCDGSTLSLLPACGQHGGTGAGSRTRAGRALRRPDWWRHPAGLRVPTGTAHHLEVDRQQRRDRRYLGAVAADAGAASGGAERRAWSRVGGVGDPARGWRAVARAGNGSVETVAVGPVRCAESRRIVGFEQRSAPRLHP